MEPVSSPLAFGLVAGRPLFLEIESDSYFLLDGEDEQRVLDQLAGGRPDSVRIDNDRLARLTSAEPPHSAVLGESLPRASFRTVGEVFRAVRVCRRRLARQPLGVILEDLCRSGRPPADAGLAAQFAAARSWVPHAPHCLVDSLALLAWLRKHQRSATLVFGAKLDPFAAHCWVEAGGVLLNDHLDEIARFTPVLRFEP